MLIKKYFKDSDRAKTICYSLTLIALLILTIMVATIHPPLLHDEPYYQGTVDTLNQYGFSIAFLNNSKIMPGPLYAVLHKFLAPITNLEVPGIRLVNVVLLGLTILLIIGVGYLTEFTSPVLSALCIISIPMTWVLSGLSLTEMPAIFFMSLGILLLFWSIKEDETINNNKTQLVSAKQIIAALLGGLAMGIAIIGRQPLLVVLAAVPILAIDSRSRIQALCFVLSGAILPILLFSIWGGLTSPAWRDFVEAVGTTNTQTFSIKHLILAYCYAGGITLILAPKFFSYKLKITLIIVIISIMMNSLFGWLEFIPMKSLSSQFIPESLFPIYTRMFSGLLFSLGVLFVASSFKNILNNRQNLKYIFLVMTMLFICFTTLKVTIQFSSRYVAQALPLFVLIAAPYTEASYFRATRIVMGSVLGLAILTSYYLS